MRKKKVYIKEISFVFLVGFKSKRGKCLDGNTKERVKGEMEMIKKTKEKERERCSKVTEIVLISLSRVWF